jgi:outer membrane protein assembly factor BamB
MKIILFILITAGSLSLSAQNWTTHNGNNERNGLSGMIGPQHVNAPVWTISNATPTGLGMNIYSFGDKFVTSRVDFSPYSAILECRNLLNGELIWTSPDLGTESILYSMGFNEDAVYAHDYHSNLFYALDANDGSVKWVSGFESYTFGPMDGVIYTCDRDVIINGELGSVDESTLCLDKETGEVLWTNANWFAVTPNESKAAHGDHLYLITGAINQPKQLCGVDIRTGETLYYSEELPGDADQEGPIAVSPDGTIYFRRDGGDFFAVEDNGSGFEILWTYTPLDMGLFVMNFGVDHEGNVLMMDNGRIYRLSRLDGSPLDSTSITGIVSGRIVVGADSTVYANDTDGKYYAFTYDLQTLKWQLNLSGNYYAGPALSKEGIMVVCGSGSSIKAYQFPGPHAPVADFAASDYKIYTGESIDFMDQSSFLPTEWQWEFPGGTPSASTFQDPQGIVYDLPGTYEVTLTSSNELGSHTLTKKCYIEVELLNEIDLPEISENLPVYPNPASDIVTVITDGKSRISIFNNLGALVYSDLDYKKVREVDVTGFPSGLYFIRFEGPASNLPEKLLVQH